MSSRIVVIDIDKIIACRVICRSRRVLSYMGLHINVLSADGQIDVLWADVRHIGMRDCGRDLHWPYRKPEIHANAACARGYRGCVLSPIAS